MQRTVLPRNKFVSPIESPETGGPGDKMVSVGTSTSRPDQCKTSHLDRRSSATPPGSNRQGSGRGDHEKNLVGGTRPPRI